MNICGVFMVFMSTKRFKVQEKETNNYVNKVITIAAGKKVENHKKIGKLSR